MSDKNKNINDAANDQAFIITEINKIKAEINSLKLADFDRLHNIITNLLSIPNIPPELRHIIRDLSFKIAAQEQQIKDTAVNQLESTDVMRIKADLDKELNDAFIHETQEQEIKCLKKEYKSYDSSFSQELEHDNKLLEKAISGKELSKNEQAKLTGEHHDPIEQAQLEQKLQKKAEKWAQVYELEEKISNSIKYKKEKIVQINKLLEVTELTPEKRQELMELKTGHQHKIEKHNKTLSSIKAKYTKRDKELELIADPKLDKRIMHHLIKKHHHIHCKKYEKEAEKDPQHKGLETVQNLAKKAGIYHQLNNPQQSKLISSAQDITKNISSKHSVKLETKSHISQPHNTPKTTTMHSVKNRGV